MVYCIDCGLNFLIELLNFSLVFVWNFYSRILNIWYNHISWEPTCYASSWISILIHCVSELISIMHFDQSHFLIIMSGMREISIRWAESNTDYMYNLSSYWFNLLFYYSFNKFSFFSFNLLPFSVYLSIKLINCSFIYQLLFFQLINESLVCHSVWSSVQRKGFCVEIFDVQLGWLFTELKTLNLSFLV